MTPTETNVQRHRRPRLPAGLAGVETRLEQPPARRSRDAASRGITVVLSTSDGATELPDVVRRLGPVVGELDRPCSVVVVDDGTANGTLEAARTAAGSSEIDALSHATEAEPGPALRAGLLRALEVESSVVVTLNVDGHHAPELLPRMLERIENGADVVVGSRFADGSRPEDLPAHRKLLSRGASTVFGMLAAIDGVRDYSSGFRAYRTELLRRALHVHGEDDLVEETGPASRVELLLKLSGLGATFEEVPLDRPRGRVGRRSLDVGSAVRRYGTVLRLQREWNPTLPLTGRPAPEAPTAADPGLKHDPLCRALNVAAASLLLVLASPLMALIALLVKATSEGPVLYTQKRIGLDRRRDQGEGPEDPRRQVNYGGRPFTIYKFRTMTSSEADGDAQVWATPDDPRVTPVGRVLRKFRLDELPQLVNVLKGDMNLVGPRPEQPEIARKLQDEVDGYRYRHRVLPGITGWAQVNHTYDRSVDDVRQKVQLDLEYIWERSVARDLRILARTVPVILFKRGAW